MDLGLKGRVALVLGAGGGLGGAIAKAMAAEGALVAAADLDLAAASRVVADIAEAGGAARPYAWDLADANAAAEAVRRIAAEQGPIDILVNITGGPPPTPASGQSPDLWRSQFESMVLSVIGLTDLVLPAMIERGWGRIITSTSSGIVSPIANLGISNALRMSLAGWSKTLAREVASKGITVNLVVPGRIATKRIEFLDQARADREGRPVESVVSESTGSIPMKRYGRPEEYANVVAFLAGERGSYITGSMVRVDGGLLGNL